MQSSIGFIDRFDASTYSVRFAGQIREFSANGYIDGKNDRQLDDCWRYGLVSGKLALENADLRKEKLDKVFNIFLRSSLFFLHFSLTSESWILRKKNSSIRTR